MAEDYRALEAAMRNDATEIRRLRAEGMAVNQGFEAGPFPLEAAIELGHLDAFWALLEGNDGPYDGGVALAAAAGMGDVATFERLLARGIPPGAMYHEDNALVAVAHGGDFGEGDRRGRFEIARRLLEAGVDPTKAIRFAEAWEDAAMAEFLRGRLSVEAALARPAPPSRRLVYGDAERFKDELHRAAGVGDLAEMRRLLGLRPDRPPTAMNFAIGNKHPNAVRLLLDQGYDPNHRAADGRTPLTLAAQHGQPEVVAMLLAAGADPNVVAERGFTAVFQAVSMNRLEALGLLLRAGADPNVPVEGAGTPLQIAVERDRLPEIVASLRSAGARA